MKKYAKLPDPGLNYSARLKLFRTWEEELFDVKEHPYFKDFEKFKKCKTMKIGARQKEKLFQEWKSKRYDENYHPLYYHPIYSDYITELKSAH